MCGIAGVMTRDGTPPDPALLDRLLRAIAHRGPDGQGRTVHGGVALLHARLAIIDLDTGEQPLFAPGGGALIGNGEIYNNPELRAAMAGTPFRTRSDYEPALFLYERDGERFAEALRGMYAIAVHDRRRNRLLLARDPFGIKPLYYVQTAGQFRFASEAQALREPAALFEPLRRAELLQLKFTTGADTIFPGIHRVLPGETLVVEGARIVARYRRPALPAGRPLTLSRQAALERLDRELLDSVSVHLRSDVPYGLFLSGGIDSSALLALMTRAAGTHVRVLTCGWEGAGAPDESFEAERLARLMGADCHRVEMRRRDFWQLAPRIAAAIDDPTADAAVLPTWMLGRAAREDGLKVALCGEGADELFAGYARYRRQRAPWRLLSRRPRSRGVFGATLSLAGWRDGLAAAEAEAEAMAGRSPLQTMQAADIAEWLPNDLLCKLDRCLMAHGVEGRTPFLDLPLADFVFRLPDGLKASLRYGKVLLREWLARALPQAGAYAGKKGFKPPVGAWMAAEAKRLGPLVAAEPGVAELLPPERVQAVFDAARTAPQPAWSLLFYALWHCRHGLGLASEGDIGEVLAAARS
jgi:asparagine synthase (glutamine-hydrolysing)